jgi:hypothetical protein
MGIFSTSKTFNAPPEMIEIVVNDIIDKFKAEGYEVSPQSIATGGSDISIAKGGSFKAALGMKTALKVTIRPNINHTFTAEAGVGIFGMQAVPAAGMLLVAWPIIIPQIWGIIQQSQLDDKVMEIIAETIRNHELNKTDSSFKETEEKTFCTNCGKPIPLNSQVCSNCGLTL